MPTYNCLIIHYLEETQIRLYDKYISNNSDIDNEIIENYPKNKKQLNKENKNDEDRSLNSSQNRSINKIYEITRSNKWEYFITLTTI